MSDLGLFLAENQLAFIGLSFLAGLLALALCLRSRAASKWVVADLVWIVFGAGAAFTAVFATFYLSERASLSRKVDITVVRIDLLLHDLARFERVRCATGPGMAAPSELCAAAALYRDALERNSELGFFLEVADVAGLGMDPGSAMEALGRRAAEGEAPAMESGMGMAEALYTGIAWPEIPRATLDRAVATMRDPGLRAEVAAEFLPLADSVEEIRGNVTAIYEAWEANERRQYFVLLRVLALGSVAFALPLRVGKAFADLRVRPPAN
jgi:hypothetical protein